MTTKVYVGDIGTAIILDCGQDISTASARSIEARRPDGTTVSWNAALDGETSLRFDTAAGTLNMSGSWKLQAKVVMPSGTWLGETVNLTVYRPFQ